MWDISLIWNGSKPGDYIFSNITMSTLISTIPSNRPSDPSKHAKKL